MVVRLTGLTLCIAFLLSINPIMAQTQSGSSTGYDMLGYCGTVDRVVSGQLSASEAAPTVEDAMIQGFCVGAVLGVRFLGFRLRGRARRRPLGLTRSGPTTSCSTIVPMASSSSA